MSRPAPASLVMHALRMQKNATASGNASEGEEAKQRKRIPEEAEKKEGGGQGIRGGSAER